MTADLDPRLAEALARLPDYLGSHVLVSVTALALGLAVSLPLALVSIRRPAFRAIALALSSIVQTIPGLALLALFYPLLLGAGRAVASATFGIGFSALGFLPSVLALALYSMLPVLRNTVTGLTGIDPAILEAALGVGMTRRQSLTMVELPLALPVIMAGIRTAAVWVIGTATLSTPIGQTSLGNYIFTGLQTQNWVFVLFGCVAAALLALAVDQLLALMQAGVGAAAAPASLSAAPAWRCWCWRRLRRAGAAAGALHDRRQDLHRAIRAGRPDRAAACGPPACRRASREGLGSNVIFDALAAGEIDVYVDYSGTIWANELHRTDVKPRAEVLADVAAWLRQRRITLLGGLGFENAYALAMARRRAEALGIRSIADLARHAAQLSIAGDYEFFARPEWAALREAYGLTFRNQRRCSRNSCTRRRRPARST